MQRDTDPLIDAALAHPEIAEAAGERVLDAAKDPKVQHAMEEKIEQKLGIDEEYKKEKREELLGLQGKTTDKVKQVEEFLNFEGTPQQISQQHSMIVLSLEYLISAFLSMIIVKIPPLAVIINFVPLLDWFVCGFFALSCVFVQFMSDSFDKAPNNFFVFLVHFISKVLLMIYFSVWLDGLKFYLYLILFTGIVLYTLYVVKTAAGAKHETNLKVKKNFWHLLLVVGASSGLLVLLTFNGFWIWLFLFGFGLLYAFFLLLALQRYTQHQFLQINYNDVYLGSTQIDADLVFSCYLVGYHFFKKEPQYELHA